MNALRRGYDTAYRTGGPITLVMSPPKLCHVPGLTPARGKGARRPLQLDRLAWSHPIAAMRGRSAANCAA
jgi:hypothetical protein